MCWKVFLIETKLLDAGIKLLKRHRTWMCIFTLHERGVGIIMQADPCTVIKGLLHPPFQPYFEVIRSGMEAWKRPHGLSLLNSRDEIKATELVW